ncbi:glucokinase, partial [Kaarinaea lacus]
MYILAGDIGGTHSRLVLAEYHDASWKILAEQHYPSSAYPDLISVIDTFITEHHISVPVDAACLAVAGPVVAGVARITNLPWSIEEKQLAEKLGAAKVRLVNDFYAVASGIAVLNAEDFAVLQHGDDKQGVAKPADAAVLGAGTGLGICHLVRQDNSFNIYPSEAGHAGFAPENKRQRELLGWLQESHEHVSQEMLLSGPGLLRIY